MAFFIDWTVEQMNKTIMAHVEINKVSTTNL